MNATPLATGAHTRSLWTSLAQVTGLVRGKLFSVDNLYHVPTINGDVKYQPKAQARFFIRNDKLEAGKACSYATLTLDGISIAARTL